MHDLVARFLEELPAAVSRQSRGYLKIVEGDVGMQLAWLRAVASGRRVLHNLDRAILGDLEQALGVRLLNPTPETREAFEFAAALLEGED